MNIWITGGGSGIGRELALLYALEGHEVVISGRSEDKLKEVVEAAGKSQAVGQIKTLAFDVTNPGQAENVCDRLKLFFSHLDLVILNAGTCEYIQGQQLDVALFRRVMDTNLFGQINALNAALPLLRQAPERPLVAGICSLAAFIGFPRAEAYGASKAAARYFLHSVRTDFKDVMDVTVVNPGFVTTPMTAQNDFPMPFLMDASRAAQRIANALRNRPLEYNFPARLVFALRTAQLFKRLWYRMIGR
ncbi:SDR family NAD(P)-dependent oxidoreductase [Pseudohongiella spirulinae]|uniref:Oxidoreductase, short-chain dehydrogenase/reductase family n=1 Tax=Pseudohongiella spirulinae TaxID=1249552 RepID=A0A0S2K9P5_9GAMM|nr:SDR family NAD(P)-dependent oxidoreductase [Pseudohongiella spirulinae]ALO45056.1 Oxidoreductase, short-chain dehydrogenase/reductase family [Pseudohongiella spirulinae]